MGGPCGHSGLFRDPPKTRISEVRRDHSGALNVDHELCPTAVSYPCSQSACLSCRLGEKVVGNGAMRRSLHITAEVRHFVTHDAMLFEVRQVDEASLRVERTLRRLTGHFMPELARRLAALL
jgi:hypothetical protein